MNAAIENKNFVSEFPLKDFEQRETPFYFYDLKLLDKTLAVMDGFAKKFDFDIHYAVKANSNLPILKRIAVQGFGADCVSGNEVAAALNAGFSPAHVLFAGVGKSDKEINFALEKNIKAFNCESIQEIEVINSLAEEKGVTTEIALRINPNVDAKTHKYITTGLDENKFGINQSDLDAVIALLPSLDHIKLTGLHFHIGSQIMDLNVFKGLCLRVNEIEEKFALNNIEIQHLNLGGGLGIDYGNPTEKPIADFETYFSIFHQFLKRRENQKIHFELGRSVIAPCGTLISRVLFIKNGLKTNFAIIDAGMTELMRPALYQSYHQIDNLSSDRPTISYDVVGPICESTDCFGKGVSLPETKRGDFIAVRSAGAYGEVMNSRYNLRDQHEAFYFEG